jgi:hypothetical protein
MTKAVTYENSKQIWAVLGLLRVWIVWYISANPTWRKDIDNILSDVQSTLCFIYRYLLTFSTWKLSLNIFPMHYLLLLYGSQRGHFSFEVQDCMFLFSSVSRINPITLYSWLILVPSSKQVVDRVGSTIILRSPKNQSNSGVVWWILLSRHYSFCCSESTLLFLVSQVDTWSRWTWG